MEGMLPALQPRVPVEEALIDVCNHKKPEKHEFNDTVTNDPRIKVLCNISGGQGTDLEKRINQIVPTSPLAFFRDRGEEILMKFIDFCKRGAFVIS